MSEIYKSKRKLNTSSSSYNTLDYIIWEKIKQINTAELVRVLAVNGDILDVKPLLNFLSGSRYAIDSATIFNVPFVRNQAGSNAIIINPQVGDIGICAFCQRDITNVKINKAQANPLTDRVYSASDAVYLGSIASLNSEPSRTIIIDNGGITINSSGPTVINASDTTVNSNLTVNGDINTTGNITAAGTIAGSAISAPAISSGDIDFNTHVHSGVTPGNSNTGGPQ